MSTLQIPVDIANVHGRVVAFYFAKMLGYETSVKYNARITGFESHTLYYEYRARMPGQRSMIDLIDGSIEGTPEWVIPELEKLGVSFEYKYPKVPGRAGKWRISMLKKGPDGNVQEVQRIVSAKATLMEQAVRFVVGETYGYLIDMASEVS